ncbi:MAG: peroxiredoxin family protein [Candidatus Cryptobacteroides sp.]
MKKLEFLFVAALAAALSVSCSNKTGIEISLGQYPDTDVIVKALNVNKYNVVDTVRTDASGKAFCRIEMEKGQPEFYYLYLNNRKLVELLLEKGEVVSFTMDSLGNKAVEGYAEAERLFALNSDFTRVSEQLSDIVYDMNRSDDDAEISALKREMGQTYVDYYRKCVRYVLENSKSMTVVPVFFQEFMDGIPVFGQATDGITMTAVADSLATVYPSSKYVKALKDEANNRMNYMTLLNGVKNAQQVSFFDVELPDIKAQKVKLSDIDARVVMLHFWTASDPEQCRFNLDVLKKYYDKYHSRGFDIYSVALDLDKTNWAKVVKAQNLPWTNVCDSNGSNSRYIGLYNIQALPASYFLSRGELVDSKVTDEKSLGELLEKMLR